MKCKLIEHFKIGSFKTYWDNYGGIDAILSSPYTKISALLSVFVIIFGNYEKWYEYPLNILPNILGFSIGAYAVILVLGNSDFWKFIAEENEDTNLFMEINGTFTHFIFIQVVAIIYAFICSLLSLNFFIFSLLGIFLLIYAIMSALAATLAILEISKWYQIFLQTTNKK